MIVRLIYGKGINDSLEPIYVNGKHLPSYVAWREMLRRTTPEYWVKDPTYKGCEVAPSWLSFQSYRSWFDKNYVESWEPDKDLLGSGKLYSPAWCVFLPHALNSLFLTCAATRGELPLGVTRHGNGYKAQCRVEGRQVKKYFKSIGEAEAFYKHLKMTHCLEQADKWEGHPKLDPRVCPAIRTKARELFAPALGAAVLDRRGDSR